MPELHHALADTHVDTDTNTNSVALPVAVTFALTVTVAVAIAIAIAITHADHPARWNGVRADLGWIHAADRCRTEL